MVKGSPQHSQEFYVERTSSQIGGFAPNDVSNVPSKVSEGALSTSFSIPSTSCTWTLLKSMPGGMTCNRWLS